MRVKLFLLAGLLLASRMFSFAADYYVATANLNVRVAAGTENSVILVLKKGDEVEVLSKDENWYEVRYLGETGYASSKHLKFSRSTSDVQLVTDSEGQILSLFLVSVLSGLALFIVIIIYIILRDIKLTRSVTEKNRGTKSERDLVLTLLKSGISSHSVFHDLYVEKKRGGFAQIDLVVVSKVGIIVFEVKDYSGWIFGSGNKTQWTQVLAYGKQKYYFYNPIMQNIRHIAELKRHLNQTETVPFYSIIVFYGDCELKSIDFVPNGTFIVKATRVLEVVRIILRENEQFNYENETEVIRVLKEAVTNGSNPETQIKHIEQIKDMLGKHRVFD